MNVAISLTDNHDDAHDLVQDTILEALSTENGGVGHHNIGEWLHGILHNLFRSGYRKDDRFVAVEHGQIDMPDLHITAGAGSDDPMGALTLSDVEIVLNSFDESVRIPFSMHLAGYKYVEIAGRLDVPVGTVKSRIAATRARLRAILSDYADC